MGGTYMAETYPGSTGDEAHAALLAHFRAEGYTDVEASNWGDDGPVPWPDPFCKGWRQVWDKPVTDLAIASMREWAPQHAEGIDPDDKWGPWLAFPLLSGGWHFFGWVTHEPQPQVRT